MERFEVWSRGAEHQQPLGLGHAEPCHFLGLVGQTFILFERTVVFFIQHHAGQMGHGQEKGRARADHNAGGLAFCQLTKSFLAPCGRLVAVVEKQRGVGQGACGVATELVRQRHLGGKQQHAFAGGKTGLGKLEINGGFAAAGYAEKQPGIRPL